MTDPSTTGAAAQRERLRVIAYGKTRAAIRDGKLVRPDACSRCGQRPGVDKLGRSRVQAHHPDYARPLEIEWLCTGCHRDETPLPEKPGAPVFGERNGMRKIPGLMRGTRNPACSLTPEQVAAIKAMRGRTTAVHVAVLCKVTDTMIRRIWQGLNWNDDVKETA